MMNNFRNMVNADEKIAEESIFGNGSSQFREMLSWLKERQAFEIFGKITGTWKDTGEFFKGKGKILKKYDGTIFNKKLYLLLNEGNLGKENILIGRRIIEIEGKDSIETMKVFQEIEKKFKLSKGKTEKVFEKLEPNTYVLENSLVKDAENQIFFRNQDYNKAVSWIKSYVNKYEITCHIEGILVSKDRQVPCIITGNIKEIRGEEIYVQLWDAFNPLDPLDDDVKEYLTREWIIQIAQDGLNKVYPRYMLFELGEELTLTKKVLSVNDVKVTLGGRVIIHDVNFEISKGDILGIIGESGAGKSTTLKAILGEFPFEGNISVFGINAKRTKEIAPFIGYVPQDLSRMYQKFNVLENVVAFGRQFGIPDDVLIQRGKSILKDLGIDHVANQKVESLSGGQKRRASIAIAMVHNPRLIFLDEPTSGLDPLARYELWEHLDMINKEYGITLCVISHYLDEIEYCDKAAIFLKGIGFYDFNTPDGLKKTMPGKGLALEVTLEDVSIEAIDKIRDVKGVEFVIQRGERVRVLSEVPSNILSKRVMKVLKDANLQIHSVEYKVQVDMVDYFTYVSIIEEERRNSTDEDGIIEASQTRKETKIRSQMLEDGYGFKKGGKVLKTSLESTEEEVDKEDIQTIREKEIEKTVKTEIHKGPKIEQEDTLSGDNVYQKSEKTVEWNENLIYLDSMDDLTGVAVLIKEDANVLKSAIKDKDERLKRKTDAFKELVELSENFLPGEPVYLSPDVYEQLDIIIRNEVPEMEDSVEIRFFKE